MRGAGRALRGVAESVKGVPPLCGSRSRGVAVFFAAFQSRLSGCGFGMHRMREIVLRAPHFIPFATLVSFGPLGLFVPAFFFQSRQVREFGCCSARVLEPCCVAAAIPPRRLRLEAGGALTPAARADRPAHFVQPLVRRGDEPYAAGANL